MYRYFRIGLSVLISNSLNMGDVEGRGDMNYECCA